MKKLLSTILVICSLLGGNAYAEIISVNFKCKSDVHKYFNFQIDSSSNLMNAQFNYKNNGNIDYSWDVISLTSKKVTIKDEKNNLWYIFLTDQIRIEDTFGTTLLNCSQKNVNFASQETNQQDIMFTIKDKREQCEAIGFKTETEKFADCVLRLVELDIKKQNQNQITSAQSSGNDALVKQLKKQSDLQSSQALINLGQQLMNPKKFNSNIYKPKVQRCTIQGYGSFANMICR